MISNAKYILPCCDLPFGDDIYSIGVEKMIKRISFLFCAVFMVVIMLALPAFAAETDDFYIIEQPHDLFVKGYLEPVSFRISVHGDVQSYLWQYKMGYDGKWLDAGWNGSLSTFSCQLDNGYDYYLVRCIVTFENGEVIISDEAAAINYPNYFTYYASRAIHFVTSWVGSITSALFSSDGAFYSLLPILAIGIAVTAALVVIKIFKSFSWGL